MAAVTEEAFLGSLDDLTGKVALVTGGAGTIGSQAAAYLAARGCLVYIADTAPRLAALDAKQPAVADWFFAGPGARVEGQYADRLRHHVLDLSSVKAATQSAVDFRSKEDRLDIVIAAAASMNMPQNQLSADGWERTWAIAHLGHVVLINELLSLLRGSASPVRPSRVVFISSNSYESAAAPDYELLRCVLPDDFHTRGLLQRGIARYQVSKLCNIYYAQELSSRLAAGVKGDDAVPVLVNCCHPGVNGRTHLGHSFLPRVFEMLIKGLLALLSHTPRDCGKTGAFLAAAADVRLRRITGEFWTPRWSWTGYWTGCYATRFTPLALDREKREECWRITEEAIQSARKES